MTYTPEVDTHQDSEYLDKHYHNVHNVKVVFFVFRVLYHLHSTGCLVLSMFAMSSWNLQLLSVLTFVMSLFLHDAHWCFRLASNHSYVGVSGLLFVAKMLVVTISQATGESYVVVFVVLTNLLFHSLFDGLVYLISNNKKLSNELHHLLPFRVETDYIPADEIVDSHQV